MVLSCVRLFVTPWTAACQAPLSFTVSQNLLKLMFFELVMPSNLSGADSLKPGWVPTHLYPFPLCHRNPGP